MAFKKIFKLYVVEEREDTRTENANVVGVFTSKAKALEYAIDRFKMDRSFQHRITQMESANWAAGETYEDFYLKIYGPGTVPDGPEKYANLLIDWDYICNQVQIDLS